MGMNISLSLHTVLTTVSQAVFSHLRHGGEL